MRKVVRRPMPLDTPARPLRTTAPEMRLPPPFTLVRLREWGDAFEHARRIAPAEGAGTLVHVGRFDLAEFALVLEPDEPLVAARRAFYAGMAALADALAAYAQPETLIDIHWPGALTVNLGLVGGGRLAWPEGTADDAVPDWLVFGGIHGVHDSHTIYAGSLDDPAHFTPTLAIFLRDKPDWVAMPEGLTVFETMPD